MDIAIKTVQPYKLYKKLLSAKKSILIKLLIILAFIVPQIITDSKWLVAVGLLLVASPIMFYDIKLKPLYEPGITYSTIRDYAKLKYPRSILIGFIIFFIIATCIAVFFDIQEETFPVLTLFVCIPFSLLIIGIKFFPEYFMNKEDRIRIKNHQDIDYNVKVDLNDIYGVNDKMILSYQNFHFNQEHLEKGNYLLGVSPLGVYFAHKNDSVIKTFIKFEDIDTLGLLCTLGNILIFNIQSKSKIEINIIIDPDDSLVVSQYKLAETLLNTLDSYILNENKDLDHSTRRRRITVSPPSMSSSSNRSEEKSENTGRSIDLSTVPENNREMQSTEKKRIVEISFTPTVNSELAAGEMITSNRQIELF